MDICCNGLEPRIMVPGRLWAPGGDANSKLLVMQMADNAAPQKPSPAENRYTLRHGTSRFLRSGSTYLPFSPEPFLCPRGGKLLKAETRAAEAIVRVLEEAGIDMVFGIDSRDFAGKPPCQETQRPSDQC